MRRAETAPTGGARVHQGCVIMTAGLTRCRQVLLPQSLAWTAVCSIQISLLARGRGLVTMDFAAGLSGAPAGKDTDMLWQGGGEGGQMDLDGLQVG